MNTSDCGGTYPENGSRKCVRDTELEDILSRLVRVEKDSRAVDREQSEQHAVITSILSAQGKVEEEIFKMIGSQRRLDASVEDVKRMVLEIKQLMGEPPDPSTGFKGTGIRGIVSAALNASTRAYARSEHPSILDPEEEGEITKVQDRPALVTRLRLAELRERRYSRMFWLKVIGLLTGGAGGGLGAFKLIEYLIQLANQ